MLCGCSENRIQTSEDVTAFCKSSEGRHITYERLMDDLENTHVDTTHKEDLANLRVISEDDISGYDTCWHMLQYNVRRERIESCEKWCKYPPNRNSHLLASALAGGDAGLQEYGITHTPCGR